VHGLALSTAHAALISVAATPTALVHAFHPILTAALGVVILRETFAWWQWLGVALGLLGVALGGAT
jgi:drug/metabolite transporter (DMT)-like permease